MPIVVHSVEGKEGPRGIEYLSEKFESGKAASDYIEGLQVKYDLSGFDAPGCRWWARNQTADYLINYWWIDWPTP